MRRSGWFTGMVVLVVVTTGCAGFYRGATTASPPAGQTVLVIGDSNAALAGPEIVATYGPELDVFVEGVGGSTTQLVNYEPTTTWKLIIEQDLDDLPNLFGPSSTVATVVVQLGTNDCEGTPPKHFGGVADAIFEIMDTIDRRLPDVPVHWNNVIVPPGNFYCLAINVLLEQAKNDWPDTLIIEDYAGHIGSSFEWFSGADLHMSDAGQQEYANWTKAYVLNPGALPANSCPLESN